VILEEDGLSMENTGKDQRGDIRNLSFADVEAWVLANGEKPFRAAQILDWMYHKGARDFAAMKNVPDRLRQRLTEDFTWATASILEERVSSDGTRKILSELNDKEQIETVLIPAIGRATVCVSTQAGCKFGCRFCASGVGGWSRNLTPAEILSQILTMRQRAGALTVTHIVFMGVGEPLDNYDNVLRAIRVINDPRGLGIAARRITVSTCGVVPNILRLAREGLQIELAVSLHGSSNPSREVLMPVNKKWDIAVLIDACRAFQRQTKRQITLEYILIKDMTCSEKSARELGQLLRGLICKMNLIPYNPVKEFDHQPPPRAEVFEFQRALVRQGVHATVRMPRGRDVAAACGQLRRHSGMNTVFSKGD
jgi:23S rRNA (adenine2503-C2)-methyltransferase